MKNSTLNEAIDASINFFEYTTTIDGRTWLRGAAIWTSYIPKKKVLSSFDRLTAYVQKDLFKSRVPLSIIEDAFFMAVPDRMQRVELVMFLDDIVREREEMN
jgi:hypothetical protein